MYTFCFLLNTLTSFLCLFRWRNIHKNLPPWILLAILTAAFMVANVRLVASSRDPDVDK